MTTLYIQCEMGAAGDMLAAALLELIPDPEGFVTRFNGRGIPGVVMAREPARKCGVCGSQVRMLINECEEMPGAALRQAQGPRDEARQGPQTQVAGTETPIAGTETPVAGTETPVAGPEIPGAGTETPVAEPNAPVAEPVEAPGVHEHDHHDIGDIGSIIDGLDIPDRVRQAVKEVYARIAAAEAEVHGVPVDKVHFHEVGAMDAVADVTAVCLLMDEIAPDSVVISPVHVGSGTVSCAHGILPVPAPATAILLKGIPSYGGDIRGELCTPTGAALLSHFATSSGPMPVMEIEKTGYGMGNKDFPVANCVRVFLGEAPGASDTVAELNCNIDDMTAEDIAFACDALMKGGALDVWTTPIMMKKGRPGTKLSVLCGADESDDMARLIFRYTGTIGIRKALMERYVLDREEGVRDTP